MDPLSIAAVGWLMSALVSKTVTALLEAWAKRISLGNEFETLKDQLLQLGALLISAQRLPDNNSYLEELVLNLQQLAYQAENLLDELDYYRLEDEIQQRGNQDKVNNSNKSSAASSSSGFRLASRSVISTLKATSCRSTSDVLVPLPKNLTSKINLSRRMNELAEQLKKSEKKVRKAVKTGSLVTTARNTEISETEATNIPQTSSFPIQPRVFGREEEHDQVVNLLINVESAKVDQVPVVAIVGSGGVGKTTLARLVFNDPKVQSYFEVRLWICVSFRFDIDRLTREMLEGACGDRCYLSNLNQLQNKLKNKLESNRFLLVLDDMWEDEDESQWDAMVAPLNNCWVKGSRILVTTRNHSVAEMIHAKVISLLGLNDDAFLSFFSTCIFNDPNFRENWRLRNIGQQIANKLEGNPLAAKTVSGLLKEKLDERYWMKIRDSEEWKSQNGPNDIMPALRLSYEHMPFHLKRCFTYCAIFPEDYPFTCEELVYLWMAQGYLDVRSKDKRMEDIGSAYFKDLLNHGFFQTIQSRYGDTVYYTFHDLIHDLAHVVAYNECLTINGTKPSEIPPNIRHLSILNITKRGEEATIRAFKSLKEENISTVLNWDELPLGTFRNISDLLEKTKFLRAVKLILCFEVQQHNFNFQIFVSLRYLRLITSISNPMRTLPREICRLYHLEVLLIDGKCLLDMLPNNFSDLISLRHFTVQTIGKRRPHSMIRGVGKLIALQELTDFGVQQMMGFEIEQLGSLQEIGGSLRIWNLENVTSEGEASKARLAEKEKLDALYLQWNHGEQENERVLEGLKPNINLKSLHIDSYGGVASPTWLGSSLIFLESLTLEDCIAWELLPPLGELEFLKHLKLSELATREIGPQFYGTRQSMKFPSLEELQIVNMPNLKKWVWCDQLEQFNCLKKLKQLTIGNCTNLVDLPLSGCSTSKVLERFPSLECLDINDCPLIFQLPPLLYSSIPFVSIARTGFLESMCYEEKKKKLSLILDQILSHKVGELLASHELNYVRYLEISYISSLQSLDLHSFLALEELHITECQSLTSLTFGEDLVSLKILIINSCRTLCSMKGLKSWVNLESLHFWDCPGFIAAWDAASTEIETTQPEFSLSLTTINGDSLALLTLPICKQLTSLQTFHLEVSDFVAVDEISLQFLTSFELFDIRGCENLQLFPFHLFHSIKELIISFPYTFVLPTNSHTEITEEYLTLRNIESISIDGSFVQIRFKLSGVNNMPAD